MSFLKIGDRAAGAIKSGAQPRAAPQMVVVDADHPDVETYIELEGKGRAEGRRHSHRFQLQPTAPQGGAESLRQLRRKRRRLLRSREEPCFAPGNKNSLRRAMVADGMIKRVIQFARQGYKEIDFPIYDTDWDLEAYLMMILARTPTTRCRWKRSISCARWNRWRTGDLIDAHHQEDPAGDATRRADLWEKIGSRRLGVRRSRPALQHHHERLAHLQASGDIRASNPCSEYRCSWTIPLSRACVRA